MPVFRGEVKRDGQGSGMEEVVVHAAGFIGGRIGQGRSVSGGGFAIQVKDGYPRVHLYVAGRDFGEHSVNDYAYVSL